MELSAILAFFAAAVAFATAAGVAFHTKSFAGRLFVVGMLVLAVESLCMGLSADSLTPEEFAHWQQLRMTVASFIPGAWVLFTLSYGRAKGAVAPARSKWLWGTALALAPVVTVAWREHLVSAVMQEAPGAPWVLVVGRSGFAVSLFLLVGAILVIMNLEKTYRAAVGTMRWRIKYMVIGLGALFVLRGFTASQVILFRSVNLHLQGLNSIALLIACILVARTLLRSGHFEVGVYVSQSVLRGSFTVLLAGVYLIVLGAVAMLAAGVGGQFSFQAKSFAILAAVVLLALVLLSDRVRMYTRQFISKHFQRPLHDYRIIWRDYTARTARCPDQASLSQAIVRLVSEVFEALSVSLWLAERQGDQLAMAASTSITAREHGEAIRGEEARDIIRAFAGRTGPVDLDSATQSWMEPLRRSHTREFPAGGRRVGVPLVAGERFLGLIVIGDRVAGAAFHPQDFELLQTIASQAAASLLNVQLSEKLSQAGQLQAFQAMSAFFVHDLKNTASTLSLMLKNLPLHFNNAEFREDALRGIARTVEHINDLIARLTLLRQELVSQPVSTDLNAVVSECLQTLGSLPHVSISQTLNPLPLISVDPSQIRTVVTNLVLNARESIQGEGLIRVESARSNGSVVLTVSDNGCGMSSDFIQSSLFRPFRTTKQKGMGVGMFQCKMIVEAHHGEIQVESQPGKGTVFRVVLPIS